MKETYYVGFEVKGICYMEIEAESAHEAMKEAVRKMDYVDVGSIRMEAFNDYKVIEVLDENEKRVY